ncbi:MAG: response regulator [Desulfobacteraceae bacterium]|jgi:putative nucleotidyltransferase with HDIG domain
MNPATKESILFVDDEESILDIARTYFLSRGYNVFTAGNGREAIDVLWNNRIDCCFTDINMPEMDGLELAEYVRNHDNTMPVVVMTGYPSLDNTIQTLKNGVVDFLIKPINLRQMEISVERVLRERKLFIENMLLTKEVEGKARLEKLNKDLLDKNEELNVVNRIMTDFAALRESTDVLNQLVDLTTEFVHAHMACFYLINESVEKAIPIANAKTDGGPDLFTWSGDPKVQKLIFDVVKDDQPLLIKNNNGYGCLPDQIHSFMLTPLKIRSKLLGVLSAFICGGKERFNEKDLYYLSFMANKAASAMESLALYENIYNNLLATLYAFVKAIEARDPYTKQHSNRVTQISLELAKIMNCTTEEQDILNVAGLLHDIGKIGIRDEILLKPGRLSRDEFSIIQQHPIIGADIMDNLGLWHREKLIVRGHHERFDGKGYPDGLKGREIPLLARILSVADVYDAIASDRAYRKRMEEEKILEIMYGGAGTQFDPEIIDVFRQLYESGEVVKLTADTQ